MQEKESIMVVQCELKIPSFEFTVRHHWAKLMMLNSYSSDRIFNPHLTTIKGERGGSVVECRTPEREVGGSKPTAAVLCP